MIENWVLRKVFGSKKEGVTGGCLPDNIRVITWRMVRWTRHVARMGRREMCTGFLVVKSEKGRSEYLTVDGRIILKCILKRWDWRACTGVIWLRIGTNERLFCIRQLTPDFIKCREFLDLSEEL
jgi:hypothetical protein